MRLIDFTTLQLDDNSPIYLQIIRFVKQGIVSGGIQDGDELPSRRVLSAQLGINPNTIQKAYRMLEEEELMQSRSGAKSYMMLTPERVLAVRRDLMESDVTHLLTAMQQMGISKAELLTLIDRLWTEEGASQ